VAASAVRKRGGAVFCSRLNDPWRALERVDALDR
jgi:hypothetical protein